MLQGGQETSAWKWRLEQIEEVARMNDPGYGAQVKRPQTDRRRKRAGEVQGEIMNHSKMVLLVLSLVALVFGVKELVALQRTVIPCPARHRDN